MKGYRNEVWQLSWIAAGSRREKVGEKRMEKKVRPRQKSNEEWRKKKPDKKVSDTESWGKKDVRRKKIEAKGMGGNGWWRRGEEVTEGPRERDDKKE